MNIGFIGIGNMGWPMAARLVAAGHTLIVSDKNTGAAEAFARETGAAATADHATIARTSDIILTILPTSTVVASVLDSLLPHLRPGTLLIDATSGDPAETRRLAAKVAAARCEMIDTPVSGGVPRARTGELAIMAGGSDAAVERARPLLMCLGTSLMRTGDTGSAHAMKALNNLASAGSFLIGIEVLLIGQRFGLDPALMVDVLNASTGMSNSSLKKFKQFVLSRRFNSGFGLDLMVKDLGIALQIGTDTETQTPLASLVHALAQNAQTLLGPGADHTEFARLAEHVAGSELTEG